MYELRFHRNVDKELKNIPTVVRRRIKDHYFAVLAEKPNTAGLMKSWQYLKPGLQEMSIYCKNLIYVKLTHEDETGAVRKRKGFISRLRQY